MSNNQYNSSNAGKDVATETAVATTATSVQPEHGDERPSDMQTSNEGSVTQKRTGGEWVTRGSGFFDRRGYWNAGQIYEWDQEPFCYQKPTVPLGDGEPSVFFVIPRGRTQPTSSVGGTKKTDEGAKTEKGIETEVATKTQEGTDKGEIGLPDDNPSAGEAARLSDRKVLSVVNEWHAFGGG